MYSKGSGLVLIFFMRNLFLTAEFLLGYPKISYTLFIFSCCINKDIFKKWEIILNSSKYKKIWKKSENPGKFHWSLLYKETFKKYVRSKFPRFDPSPSPLFALVCFRAPPPPKVRSFWLELTLSPSISILVKFREKKLIMTCFLKNNAGLK